MAKTALFGLCGLLSRLLIGMAFCIKLWSKRKYSARFLPKFISHEAITASAVAYRIHDIVSALRLTYCFSKSMSCKAVVVVGIICAEKELEVMERTWLQVYCISG